LTTAQRRYVLLSDIWLLEKHAHFNRERVPERVVHAKGSGAYGTFTVTNDISQYTKAAIFAKVGKKPIVWCVSHKWQESKATPMPAFPMCAALR